MHHYEGTLYNMDGTKLYNSLSIVTEIYETFMDYRTIDWADRFFLSRQALQIKLS